ncbi:MAG: hypothetical protein WCS74_04285 [Dehalococcoidales bacterium]|jgi:hypothetical protein
MPEDITELYDKFESAARSRKGKGEIAQKIRDFVEQMGAKLGKTEMSISALHKMAKELKLLGEDKVEYSYFNNVCQKTWEITRNEEGVAYIDLNKPKSKNK